MFESTGKMKISMSIILACQAVVMRLQSVKAIEKRPDVTTSFL